jgi:sensor domain CHASE-containing protein
MKPWIYAFAFTAFAFVIIEYKNRQDSNTQVPKITNMNKAVILGCVFVVSVLVCTMLQTNTDNEIAEMATKSVKAIESEMLKNIHEDISVGLPRF